MSKFAELREELEAAELNYTKISAVYSTDPIHRQKVDAARAELVSCEQALDAALQGARND